MTYPILKLKIKYENDIVLARQRTRAIAELIGFETGDQVRCATAVSEIARNAYQYAGGGDVEFLIEGNVSPQVFVIKITDQGKGIPNLEEILDGLYQSKTGLGLGIIGAKRLMDHFNIESKPGKGTAVFLGKNIPGYLPIIDAQKVGEIVDKLSRQIPTDPFSEIQRQNQELLHALEILRMQKEELERLNQELSDTNRGILALYAELEEKASNLRRANELKARFLSNMSHEFRTPLNSIISLSRLLLDRIDGDLTPEQEKQVIFIKKAAEDLSNLVNDLLDLAKIEAGKLPVHVSEFTVEELFSTLRGMVRPLKVNPNVELIFETPKDIPPLHTDEGKVSQILRNLISNALKFTEKGEVRVAANLSLDGQRITFSVSDTGIGIAPEHHELIFQEYGQVDSPIQRKVKGTGLGLPLSRHLAELLGGNLTLKSELGVGSTFYCTIPIDYEKRDVLVTEMEKVEPDIIRHPVLVVEDEPEVQELYEKFLARQGYQILKAYNLKEARQILGTIKPIAIILDLLIPNENPWDFLIELRSNPATYEIPIYVATIVQDEEKAFHLGATDFCVKPVDRKWLLAKLREASELAPISTVLIIDDEEVARYILKSHLADTKFKILEAENGKIGIEMAKEYKPDLILLDLIMPEMSGFEVLAELRSNEQTANIPVIVVTSKILDESDLAKISKHSASVLSKNIISTQTVLNQVSQVLKRFKK